MAELIAQDLEGHAVLQSKRHGGGETVHKARNGRAFLRGRNEDLSDGPILVEPNGQISLIPANIKVMHNGFSLVGQAPPDGLRCPVIFDFRHGNLAKYFLHPIKLAFACSEVKRPTPVE